jgi:hypothetical protein
MRAKRATKTEIDRAIREIAPEGKYRVAAQGVTEMVHHHVRLRMGMGTRDAHYTKMERNGRYRVTVWGKNAPAKMQRMIDGMTAAGYIVENIGMDDFEVHNGTVIALDGILRYEGTC